MSSPISYAAGALEEALKAKGIHVTPFESKTMAVVRGDLSRTTIHAITQAVVFTFIQNRLDEGRDDADMNACLVQLLSEVKE